MVRALLVLVFATPLAAQDPFVFAALGCQPYEWPRSADAFRRVVQEQIVKSEQRS